jgi:predicted MPP superfamily phosphohydrolase
MKSLVEVCKSLMGKFTSIHRPEDLLNDVKGPVLLHISDTPSEIYPFIFKIIDVLKPKYIIHTGDLADNVKLEINRDRIKGYSMLVKELVEGLENTDTKVYYFMGNHDDYDTVSKLSKKGTILEEGLLTIEELNFTAGHYYKGYPYKADFNLFGHSFEPCHYKNGGTIGLNGVLSINVIDLSNKRVFHLNYPIGTNRLRGMESKKAGL